MNFYTKSEIKNIFKENHYNVVIMFDPKIMCHKLYIFNFLIFCHNVTYEIRVDSSTRSHSALIYFFAVFNV